MLSYDNNDGKGRIYCRITSSQYHNPKTCLITYQRDSWISKGFDATYGRGLILREHPSEADWQLANQNPHRNDVLFLTCDEGDTFSASDYVCTSFYPWPSIPRTSQQYVVCQIADFDTLELPGGIYEFAAKCKYLYDTDGYLWPNTKAAPVKELNYRIPHGFWWAVFASENYDGKGTEEEIWGRDIIKYLTVTGFNIVMIYSFHSFYFDLYRAMNTQAGTGQNLVVNKPKLEDLPVSDPKLLRSPYCYFEINNNYGGSSGFNYEGFQGAPGEDGTTQCKFRLLPLFDDVPRAVLAPEWYYYNVVDHVIATPTFRQIGWSGDGFADFVATIQQSNLEKLNEYTENYWYRKYYETGSDLNRTLVGNIRMVEHGVQSLIGGATQGAKILGGDTKDVKFAAIASAVQGGQSAYHETQNEELEVRNTYQYTQDPLSVLKSYNGAAPAFVGSKYTAPSNIGYCDYVDYNDLYLGNGVFSVYVKRVMDPVLVSKAHEHQLTGYPINTVSTPLILSYIGATVPTLGGNPHFTAENYTYCKCEGLYVEGLEEEDCDAITNMFASGVRFTKFDA